MKRCIATTILLSFFLLTSTVSAKPVYKWTDAQGITHYSSNASNPEAKTAKLPEISRGEVKLAKRKLLTCSKHGGVNCQAGADKDGSVICYDGFKLATARYRFTCSSPKLNVTDVSPPAEDGSFSVFVRNERSVEATKPTVYYKPNEGDKIPLAGPKKVEAFGLAEFTFKSESGAPVEPKVSLAQIDITCANCP